MPAAGSQERKPFADIRLGDRSGEIALKVWGSAGGDLYPAAKRASNPLDRRSRNYNNIIQLEADGKEDFYRICREGGVRSGQVFTGFTGAPGRIMADFG